MDDLFDNKKKRSNEPYSYTKQIKVPSELGMSGDGKVSTLTKNIGGLIGYTQILVQGGGRASKIRGPLGDKYFFKTAAECKDVDTGRRVMRSIFINNIPDGSIPFISSGLGVRFRSFRGLIPGLLGNLAKLDPTSMFTAFSDGASGRCKAITLQTRDANNETMEETAFLSLGDIKKLKEGFQNNEKTRSSPAIVNSDISDIITYLYYATILGLLIYVIAKLKR